MRNDATCVDKPLSPAADRRVHRGEFLQHRTSCIARVLIVKRET